MKKNGLAMMSIVTMLYWAGMYTYNPILTVHAQSIGASMAMIGLISGSYGLSQLICRVPAGILSDRLGKRKLFVIVGTVLCVISAAILMLGQSPLALLIGRSISGIGASMYVPISMLFASYYDEGDMSKAAGFMSAISALGQMAAQLLGGWLYDVSGRWGCFGSAILLAVIGMVLAFTIKEPPVEKQDMRIRDVLEVAANRELMIASLMCILLQGILFAKAYSYTQVIANTLRAESWQLGVLTTVVSLGSFLSSLLSGQVLSAKIGDRACILMGFLLHVIATMMVPYAGSMWVILASQALTGLAQGLVFPMLMSLGVSTVAPERRTTAMGFFQALYGLGMFAVPWLIGIINDAAGVTVGFWCIAALGVIGFVIELGRKPSRKAA